MPAARSASRWSARRRSARSPAWTRGWSVFTRPSSISGKPVTAATSVTGRPASRRARAVPPVLTSSQPRTTSPRPRSTRPRLVVDGEERAARDRDARVRGGRVQAGAAGAALDGERPGQQRRHGRRQQPVLDRVDPREKRCLVVVRQDRHRLLGHDRAAVQRRVHQVHGHAGHRHAGGQGVARPVEPGEGRQQRRVHVEDPAAEGRQHGRADQPQVAGEDHDVRRHGHQRLREGCVVATGDQDRLDPLLRRPVQARARAVREDQHDVAAQLTSPRRRDQRPQVGPAPRDPDRDPAAGRCRR